MQNTRFNLYSTKVPRLTTPFGEVARCSVAASASKPITTTHTSPPPPIYFTHNNNNTLQRQSSTNFCLYKIKLI